MLNDDDCDTCEPSARCSVRFSIFLIRDESYSGDGGAGAGAVTIVAFCLYALTVGTLALLTFLQVPLSMKPKSKQWKTKGNLIAYTRTDASTMTMAMALVRW